jgi:hypothetical protein
MKRTIPARHRALGAARTVSATKAAKNFGRLVNTVRDERAVYIVERGGVPVAEIGPPAAPPFRVSDLVELLRTLPRPGEAYWRAVRRAQQKLNKRAVPTNPWAR